MGLSAVAKLQLTRVLLVFLCVADAVTSSLLLTKIGGVFREQPSLKDVLYEQVLNYHFGISSFDVWLTCLVRSLLFLSLTLSFSCCNKLKVLRLLKSISTASFLTLAVYFCFIIAKLLTSFEFYPNGSSYHGPTMNQTLPLSLIDLPCVNNSSIPCGLTPTSVLDPYHPWLWGSVGWATLGSVLYAILLLALVLIKPDPTLTRTIRRLRILDLDIETNENSPLLNRPEAATKEETKNLSALKIMCRCLSYAKSDIYLFLLGYFFLAVSSITMAFIPYYTGQIINHIAIAPSAEDFQHAILVMSSITIVSAVSAGLRGMILVCANAKLNIRIRRELFKALLKQEVGFFDTTDTGDLTSRLSSDTTKLADQIGLNLNVFLRNLIQFVGSLVFMIQLTWKLSTITIVGIPLITVVTKLFGEKLKNYSKKTQDSFAKANNVAEEVLSSMKTVRSFANEEEELRLFSFKLKHTQAIFNKASIVYGSWMLSSNLLGLVIQVVTLYYGGHLVIYNEISGGELVSLLLYQVSLTAALDAMGSVFTGLMQAAGAGETVFELIDRQPKINHSSGSLKDAVNGKVEFRDVTFSYPSRPTVPVLRGVSFTAQPGEVVALVGPSGGGKSSCISLLERFYTPTAGQVLLDGRELSVYDHKHLHTKVSLVGQEPVLYARSIAENIAYGTDNTTQDMIQGSAKLANAHEFISHMIKGYNTHIGEKGGQLSGGQKQRVAIARALIRDPNVLLLDEATSALDAESEHLVQQALNKNLQGRTVIIIAHRLSTVEKADKIVVIKQGQVEEEGSHFDLLKKGGLYASLVSKQMMLQTSSQEHKVQRLEPSLTGGEYGSYGSTKHTVPCNSQTELVDIDLTD